ncbi:MAG: hypothetical protein HC794_03300 [Nitrospiraceae bacterium]|nr:hypothetical protein [Nitrospiraceae bacterium]
MTQTSSATSSALIDAAQALAPVLGGLTNLGRRFTPVGYVDSATIGC